MGSHALHAPLPILRCMGHFDGQVVVVTGASSGVGRAVARAFGAEGARVALVARNPEALENGRGRSGKFGWRGCGVSHRRRRGGGRGGRRPHGRPALGRNRRLGEQRDGDRSLAGRRDDRPRVPARDRRDLSRHGARNLGRAPADASSRIRAPSSRSDRRSPTAPSRCRARTAARRQPFAASPTRSARSSCTIARRSGCACSSSRR